MPGRPKEVIEYPQATRLLVFEHYRTAEVLHGWDRKRTERLMKLTNLEPSELEALFCIHRTPAPGKLPQPGLLMKYLYADLVPPPIALHFALLESWLVEHLGERLKGAREDYQRNLTLPLDVLYRGKSFEANMPFREEGYAHD
jgi:hypothetical protein